jgi:hypothetical protein
LAHRREIARAHRAAWPHSFSWSATYPSGRPGRRAQVAIPRLAERAHGRRAAAPGEPHRMPRLATIVYVVIGVIVASQHAYYAQLGSFSQVLSAVVATALWPLVLLGADLHLSLANL